MNQFSLRLQRLPIPAALTRGLSAAGMLLPGLALAGGPSGGVVVAGGATISNPSSNGTVINQTTGSAVINWNQFNIGSGDYVQFVQPSSSSLVLNRVIGGSPSQILGDLSANGRVFIINPQGVLFGAGARVDVGALVASTLDIKDADFMSGHYVFSGGGNGASVVNDGNIKAANGGFVVLAGDYVKNSGVIQAQLGQVVLASGSAVTMDLDGQGLVSVAVDQATLAQKAGVDNAGQILADGGRVIMTAETARGLVGSAVNNSGLVRAQGISSHDGEIELTASGGDITDSGTLDVSSASGAGGQVQIHGDQDIALAAGSQVLASGASGGAVQVVADGKLTTAAGSLIDAHGAAGQGGYAELSGHGQLLMRGNINLGSGGKLVIDPTDLTIANGNGSSTSSTVYEQFLEGQLQNGTSLELVASNSITLGALTDGTLNGVGSVAGGSLLLGIGSISSSSGASQIGTSGSILTGGSFVEGGPGKISFADGTNLIDVNGSLTIDAGKGGTVDVGGLSAGGSLSVTGGSVKTGDLIGYSGVTATADTSLTTGNVTATGGSITLSSGGGIGGNGNITAGHGSIEVDAYGGAITLGNLSATNLGSYGGSASIGVHGSGAVTVGSVTTDASTSNQFGSANGSVAIDAGYYGSGGGDLTVNGPISTTASGAEYNDNASVELSNAYGGVTVTGAINTGGAGLFENASNVSIAANGNVNAADIGTQHGAIAIDSYGGNIVVGNLSTNFSGSYGGDASVNVHAYGGVQTGSISTYAVSTDSEGGSNSAAVNLDANYYGSYGGGDLLVTGNISTYAAGSDSGNAGSININNNKGSVTVQGSITAQGASGNGNNAVGITADGDVTTQAITAYGGSIDIETFSPASGNGNISVGTLSGGQNNSLSSVYLSAYGGLTVNSDIAANSVSLYANNGSLSAGSIVALNPVQVSDYGGDLTLGTVSTSGYISLVDYGGNLKAGNLVSLGNNSIEAVANDGDITLQGLSGGTANASLSSVYLQAYGSISTATGDTITAGSITMQAGSKEVFVANPDGEGGTWTTALNSSSGKITTGNLTTTAGTVSLVNDAGDINVGDISTSDIRGSDGGSANATVTVHASGSISTGNIATHAQSASSSAYGYVDLEAGYTPTINTDLRAAASSVPGATGSLIVNGTITTSASAGSGSRECDCDDEEGSFADAHVSLTNYKGSVQSGDISPGVSGGSLFGNTGIGIVAYGGSLTAGNLSTGGGQIDGNFNSGAGNIFLYNDTGTLQTGDLTTGNGQLTVNAAGGDATLGNISTTADNPLENGGADASVTVYAAGGISTGSITTNAQASNDANGSVTLEAQSPRFPSTGSSNLLVVNGPISTSANGSGSSVTAGVSITNFNGAVQTGDITTSAPSYGHRGGIGITAYGGGLTLGNLNSGSGNIGLSTDTGTLQAGDLTTGNGNVVVTDSGGSIVLGNISTTAYGSSGAGADATVTVQAAGGIQTGSINTYASASSFASAYVSLEANTSRFGTTPTGGDIVVQGNIATTAVDYSDSGSASGTVQLTNFNGGIGTQGIKTYAASGSTYNNASITLAATNGDITTGDLTVTDGSSIGVTTTTAGNINVGQMSAYTSSSDGGVGPGQLNTVTLSSAGGVTTNGTAIIAQGVTLNAGTAASGGSGGDISTGDITVLGGGLNSADYGGSMTLGNINAAGTVGLYADGGITTGSITGQQLISVIGSGGDVSVGALAPQSNSSLDSIDVEAGGALTVGGDSIAAGTVTLSAGNGNLNAAGAITGQFGFVTISDSNGTAQIGNVTADGKISITGTDATINTGNLAAIDGSSVSVTTSGSGDISVGAITGSSSGALASVNLSAAGGLTTNGQAITASSVTLAAGSGDLTATGTITSTDPTQLLSISDGSGKITLGNVSAAGNLNISDGSAEVSGNGISAGDLSVKLGGGSISVTSFGDGADIAVGQVSGGSVDTPLSSITLTAGGGLKTATGATPDSLSADSLTLSSANGDLTTGDLTVTGAEQGISVTAVGGNLNVGAVQTNAGISLSDTGGNLGAGSLTVASGSGVTITSDGNVGTGVIATSTPGGDLSLVDAEAGGTLSLGNSSITADTIILSAGAGFMNLGALNGGAGGISLTNTGGAIAISSATTTDSGDITANANSAGVSYDTIDAAGSVTLSGTSISADNSESTLSSGHNVSLTATAGGIGTNDIGSSESITLSATGGDITTGNLTGGVDGTVSVTTVTSGNINVGAIGTTGGSLDSVQLTSAGSLTTNGHDITAGSISLSVADGDLSAGNLNASGSQELSVADTGGKVTLLGVTSGGDISITDSEGTGIQTGNLAANGGGAAITVSSTGSGADISIGTISGGTTDAPLSSVSLTSGGSLSASNTDITAGSITLSAGSGALSFGKLDALDSGLTINNAGDVTLGSVTAAGNVDLTTTDGGKLSVSGPLSATGDVQLSATGGDIGTGSIQGASLTATTITSGNISVGAISGASGDMSSVSLTSAGSLKTGGNSNITAGSILLSAASGDIDTGALNATSGDITVTGSGNIDTGKLTASGNKVSLTVNGDGTLTTGDIGAGSLSTTVGNGNETLGNVSVNDLSLVIGDKAGQTLQIASLDISPDGNTALNYGNANLSIGSVTIGDGSDFSAVLTNGNLSVGGVSSSGDVTLTATHGSLGLSGSFSGQDITLSTGQGVSLSGVSVNASGDASLAAGGNTSLSASLIEGGNSANITSSGSLGIDNSSVLAPTVTLNATGAITVSGGSAIGTAPQQQQGTDIAALAPRVTGNANSVAMTSGSDISIDDSSVHSGQITLSGRNITLSNGTDLNGSDAVVLTGTGAVAASGSGASIEAGALSVKGASIDFTKAPIQVGSGIAAFGSDATLLQAIAAKNPKVNVPNHGPNASFSAAGGVKLGSLTVGGGYLFIQAPTLSLPSQIGGSGLFVDYLPTNPSAPLSVDLTQPLSGSIATLVFGGTPQSGDIQIGNGNQTFKLAGATNLVFDTSGRTLYPDSISSNGVVVVLGNSVLRTPPVDLTDVPLTTDQYDDDAPNNGPLGDKGDPGDPDDPGVNDANKGRIDITSNGSQPLSCGIGGTP